MLVWSGGCGAATPPPCFPPIEVASAKLIRVERNGDLVLSDGRAAKLEGILLPAGGADGAPDSYATAAIGRLSELAAGHSALLAAEAPKEDRYGRLRAQVLVSRANGAVWLQRALLEDGLARVDVAPDRNECVPELYAAEARARESRAGLWADAAYVVHTPTDAGKHRGTFQIVEGTVARVQAGAGNTVLEFSPGANSGFAVAISRVDLRIFRAIGVDPYSYEGQTVRVRGWIEHERRPEMEIATPSAIEVVRSPTLRGSIAAPSPSH